ncbi:MAG: helix-turn-helix transcriptional regulator [Desulfarculales bacterium]|jgi:transcriptional regulator with XRE-family HTH domain|nr:helix-turn-helix transcriptional regulator [Desulfarculales bacterium]
MEHGVQKKLSALVEISPSYLCQIVNGCRNPSWRVAKKLARATNVSPELWMESSSQKRRKIVDKWHMEYVKTKPAPPLGEQGLPNPEGLKACLKKQIS